MGVRVMVRVRKGIMECQREISGSRALAADSDYAGVTDTEQTLALMPSAALIPRSKQPRHGSDLYYSKARRDGDVSDSDYVDAQPSDNEEGGGSGRVLSADVLDLLVNTPGEAAPGQHRAGAYGQHTEEDVRPSGARGAAAGVVMFEEEANRYRDAKGVIQHDRNAAEYHFRRAEFRLRVRTHPAAKFLRKVHGFTSGTTQSYTIDDSAYETAEKEGAAESVLHEGSSYDRGVSVPPGEAAIRAASKKNVNPYQHPPGHDITGILRIDPRVEAAMDEAALFVIQGTRSIASSLRGANVWNLAADNEYVQTTFARLTASLFLLSRLSSGSITVNKQMIAANVRTRNSTLTWMMQHTSFSRGHVCYHMHAGGPVTRLGDFPRTPHMGWTPETGYARVDEAAGLGSPPPSKRAAWERGPIGAYIPHGAPSNI